MALDTKSEFGAPISEPIRSFESKCTVLKKVLATFLGLFGALRSDFGALDSLVAP